MLNFRHHILKLALLVMGIVESTILVMCQSLFSVCFAVIFVWFNSIRVHSTAYVTGKKYLKQTWTELS